MATMTMGNRRTNPFPFLIGLLAVTLIISTLFLVRNAQHANARHAEAEMVRSAYRDSLCSATEAWIWPAAGTVLVLCKIPNDVDSWGGMTMRFVENGLALVDPSKGAVRILDETNQAYEATTMARPRAYWDGVIARGYEPLWRYSEVEVRFWAWLWSVL